MFIRLNTALRDHVGRPPFDHRFGVAVPLHSPNADGLPGNSESEELTLIEEQLVAEFVASKQTHLAVVITTSGFREFVFYTSAPHDIQPAMQRFTTRIASHKLQFYIKPDPGWQMYKSFVI